MNAAETTAPIANTVAEKFWPSVPRNAEARRLVQPKTSAPQPRKSTLRRRSRAKAFTATYVTTSEDEVMKMAVKMGNIRPNPGKGDGLRATKVRKARIEIMAIRAPETRGTPFSFPF